MTLPTIGMCHRYTSIARLPNPATRSQAGRHDMSRSSTGQSAASTSTCASPYSASTTEGGDRLDRPVSPAIDTIDVEYGPATATVTARASAPAPPATSAAGRARRRSGSE